MKKQFAIEFGKCAFALDERHMFLQLWDWQLFIAVALDVDFQRYKFLANGDMIPWSEVVAPDDWRNQPTRPNGLPW